MKIHHVETYWANIYVGLMAGYNSKKVFTIDSIKNILQEYMNQNKMAVTLTPTNFIYVDGREPGVIVGLINYPRFPSTREEIIDKAGVLAVFLKEKLLQERVSIVFPDHTVMLGEL